jgi:hypothetical protein
MMSLRAIEQFFPVVQEILRDVALSWRQSPSIHSNESKIRFNVKLTASCESGVCYFLGVDIW